MCSGTTGHAETVEVTFDPTVISYESLLDIFWNMHNPTQGNRQGLNFGSQYRSAIFCASDEHMMKAVASRDALQAELDRKITTELVALKQFWPAEEYHQKYYVKKGVSACGLPQR